MRLLLAVSSLILVDYTHFTSSDPIQLDRVSTLSIDFGGVSMLLTHVKDPTLVMSLKVMPIFSTVTNQDGINQKPDDKIAVSLDYYNSDLKEWEPVLEPSTFGLEVRMFIPLPSLTSAVGASS